MNFPLISEYVEAVKMAEDNFEELCHLRPVLDKDGQPVMSSGNFAVVFKMRDTESGKFHAVRCFHREQEGRTESYRQIEEALRQVQSPYLVSFRYMDKELFVDSKQTGGETEFPVLLMDWVEGVTLDRYIREHIDDKDALEVLAYRFSLMASWLIAQPFAHGDLKPDNILVRPDGTITLVDYDGMFVPSMQGQSARELGSPDFRHPLRKEADFDGSIDDFPLVSILLSLKAIAVNPSLLDQFGASDRLLFSEVDYRDISRCRVLHEIFPSSDNELNKVISLFTLALTERRFAGVAPSLLELAEPACLADEELSTKVTKEDLAEAIEDDFGVKYSKYGKRLLTIVDLEEYTILEGTRVICSEAFFPGCYLQGWGDDYYECFVESNLKSVYIPDSVKIIGYAAFLNCSKMKSIRIPDGVNIISSMTFQWCFSLNNVYIPDSVTIIGESAFAYCHGLTSIEIPNKVKTIEKSAFLCCDNLISIHLSNNLTEIGESAFSSCSALTNIDIPKSVIKIGCSAFSGCKELTSINIPGGVEEIEEWLFANCGKLVSVNISQGVRKIKDNAFNNCEGLTSVNIPGSVIEIGERAFENCWRLTSINIPQNTREKFAKLLPSHKHLLVEK